MFIAPKTEHRMKRWQEQRWILDAIVQSVGVEWDQPRLGYTMYPAGLDAAGDFRTVGIRVKKFADIDREFANAARRREARAQAFEQEGRLVSARENYFIAAMLYSAARWPIFENNPTSIGYNDRMVACYDKYAEYAPRPVERVEIPFEGKSLPGYLHLPHAPQEGERFPLVIGIDGMDGSKEIMCAMYGDKFIERGFANFIYDGPGQGECTIREILVTPENHMAAAEAVWAWAARHPHIDTDRVVLWGVSFGSYFGFQAAAQLGERLKGTAVTFVCHEPGMNALMNMASPSFKMRFMYMAGYDDEAEFDRFCEGFTLEPHIDNVRCPMLVQAGEEDELSPLVYTEQLVERLTVPKRLVVYEGDRHAIGSGSTAALMGEHWMVMIADWLRDRIDGKPVKSERVHINALGQQQTTPYD